MSAEMAVEPILSMSTELMDRFRKWIGSLHTNTNDRPLCNVIKDGKALNFNYTEFVEDLYGVDAGIFAITLAVGRRLEGDGKG